MTQPATWGVPLVADAPVTPTAIAIRMDDCVDALLASHAGAARPTYAVTGTFWHDTDTAQWFAYSGTADLQVAVNVGAPASAAAAGNTGDMAWDADYIYVCTATNTWKRVAIATW